ncbi:MAG: phosphate regulon transcriptional regulator PhoB [Gammaproteobacteria bacterium]
MVARKPYILVVEDDTDVREMITFALGESGMEVTAVADADEGWRTIGDGLPSLVLLDWMLPGVSGIDFLRRLRRDAVTRNVPVIMLTAKTEEADRVRGLDTGADDYIAKPFSVRELKSRISAVLRRAAPEATETIVEAGALRLDPSSHRVSAGTEEIALGPTEFRLLHFLMTHKDRVFSRRQLLDRVWGTNVYVEERTVDVHIRRLRKALEPHKLEEMIQTVRGAGYRFSE